MRLGWGPDSAIQDYLGHDERVVLQTRQHPFAIVGELLATLNLVVPLGLVLWGLEVFSFFRTPAGDRVQSVGLLLMLFLLVRLVWSAVVWEVSRVVVTTEKVMHIHGVITRHVATTPLVKVSELVVRQSLLGRLLGYGMLLVDAPGGGQPLHGLSFIPAPAEVYRAITDTARRERAFEGGAFAGPDLPDVTDIAPSIGDDAPTQIIDLPEDHS